MLQKQLLFVFKDGNSRVERPVAPHLDDCAGAGAHESKICPTVQGEVERRGMFIIDM
jgi:hypothetical protein